MEPELAEDDDAMPWRERAACRDEGHLFYAPHAERPETAITREAAALYYCSICPVLHDCRVYARKHREYGIWGGETEMARAAAGRAPRLPVGNVARMRATVGSG